MCWRLQMGVIDRDYEDLRHGGRIVLFLREGKNPKYSVRLKAMQWLSNWRRAELRNGAWPTLSC